MFYLSRLVFLVLLANASFIFAHTKTKMDVLQSVDNTSNYTTNAKGGTTPPIAIIEKVYTQTKNSSLNVDTVSYGDSVFINCNYSGLLQGSKIITQFRLLGLNDEWTKTKSKHFAFSGLQPGKYYFQYRVKSEMSYWSNSKLFSFVVARPFWAKSSFVVLLFSIIIFFSAIVFCQLLRRQHISDLISLNHKYEMSVMKSRLLHSMMSPHFIFNMLNSIHYYVSVNNSNEAESNLTLFSNLIRKNLEVSQSKYISIDEEIIFLELYLSVEKKRKDNAFTYQINHSVDIDTSTCKIPSLMIQPIAENSILHGILPKDGNIKIDFIKHDSHLEVVICDNGVGYDSKKAGSSLHNGLSLKVIKERLSLMKYHYGFAFNIKFSNLYENQGNMPGTRVSIDLPFVN